MADPSRAKADALRLLKLRPRTERELRWQLNRRGHPPEDVDSLLQELKKKHLVDDARFFGLSGGTGHCVPPIVEARILAARQAARMEGLPAPAKARRLCGFLSRRGFGEEVVEQVVGERVPHEGG